MLGNFLAKLTINNQIFAPSCNAVIAGWNIPKNSVYFRFTDKFRIEVSVFKLTVNK